MVVRAVGRRGAGAPPSEARPSMVSLPTAGGPMNIFKAMAVKDVAEVTNDPRDRLRAGVPGRAGWPGGGRRARAPRLREHRLLLPRGPRCLAADRARGLRGLAV